MVRDSLSTEQILEILQVVKDPEIPVLSVVDMGIITHIAQNENGKVLVTITPTFTGCPAIDAISNGISQALLEQSIENEVKVSFEIPWTSDRLSDKGKQALKDFGLAPPPHLQGLGTDIDLFDHIACPYCNSTNTVLKSFFGPTLCRSLHYCNGCLQAFEQFKPV